MQGFNCANLKDIDLDEIWLPNILRDYHNYIKIRTNCSSISAIINTISLVSALVGEYIYLPKTNFVDQIDGYFQDLYPNLWLLEVNKSGSFKSTAQRTAHEIIQSIELELEAESVRNEWPEAVKDSLSFFLPDKITFQALLLELSKTNGGLVLTSEFSAWLKSLSAAAVSETLMRATLTDFFDVPPRYTYCTKKEGKIRIESPFISITGVTTYSAFQSLIDAEDVLTGFLPRFLLFTPPQDDNVPAALPGFQKSPQYKQLEVKFKGTLTSVCSSKQYTIANDAKKEFENIHAIMYSQVRAENPDIREYIEPFLKRWSPYILKIAMLFEVCKDNRKTSIGPDSILSAGHIIRYAYDSTRWLLNESILMPDFYDKIERVMNYLKSNSGSCTREKLLQSKRIEGGAKELDSLLKHMVDAGDVKITTGKNKQSETYTIIPKP